MFEEITWKEYLAFMAIAMITYYTVIGFLFHRNGININLKRVRKRDAEETGASAAPDEEEDHDEAAEEYAYRNEEDKRENLFDELEEIVTDIRHSILEKAGKEADKDMLLMQLKSRVANYDGLRQPAYRVALNNFIIHHAESICGIVYSNEELDSAWDSIPH